ncbi:MAG: ABC transporter substrate-binding protein [Magnetococcales bacterium]|nr:ABC transporter substrate-binding protein [Magnetococcales bacterium]
MVNMLINLTTYAHAAKEAEDDGKIHIAVVGPMTGKTAGRGESIRRGVEMKINNYNEMRQEGEREIVVTFYDDQNKPDLAEKRAIEVIKDNRAVAVIGHNYSSSSKRGGPIYKKAGIPAISPTSTDVAVTTDNDWYFRTVFNDDLQGRFLANYANNVMGAKSAVIISEDLAYGSFLADTFARTAKKLNLPIVYRGNIVVSDPNLDASIDNIVKDLKEANNDFGVLFLATHAGEGITIVQKLRDAGLMNPIITPDSFASKSFREGFNHLPKESDRLGFYSNGIHVTTPLIFDTGNEKAQVYREKFHRKFSEEPDWISAFSYDSALLLVEAILQSKVSGKVQDIKKDREKIRNFLAGLNSPTNSIEGITGLNFFDSKGDAQKPISIGKFQNRSLISATTQLQVVRSLDEIDNLNEQERRERIILVEDNKMHRVNVVFTGFKINKIEKLDLKALTFDMDLYIWFRFQGDLNVDDIIFLNALNPITWGEPIESMEVDQSRYRRYHIRGTFLADFLNNIKTLGRHTLGLNFQHDKLSRNNLIFVSDVLGMRLETKGNLADIMNQAQILGPSNKWLVDSVHIFQDVTSKETYGSLYHLNATKDIEFSRFNISLQVKKDEVSLRGQFSVDTSLIMVIASAVLLFISIIRRRISGLKNMHNLFWLITSASTFALLLGGEIYLAAWLSSQTTPNNMALLPFIFDILWWLAWAFVINLASENFLWLPMESKTGQVIPKIIRRFLTYAIFTLAIFGIIAFVFDQRLTSLLATSGMIAMIIGLAIQANISNIFSGIAINVERPFRIGDWVRINDRDEGRVEDITWRSTKLWNRDGSISRIPNAIVSEACIRNFTDPDSMVENWIFFELDPKHPPALVEAVLTETMLSIPEVVNDPAPFTSFRGVEKWAAKYMLGFTIKDYGKKAAVRKKVTKKVWADLKLAGFTLATERRNLITKEEESEVVTPFSVKQVLENMGLYKHLPEVTRNQVDSGTLVEEFEAGQTICKRGTSCSPIIVFIQGVGSILATLDDGENVEIKRVGSGDFFGENAALNGQPRLFDIVSYTDTRILRISDSDLAYMFEQNQKLEKTWTKILNESAIQATERTERQQQKRDDLEAKQSTGFFKKLGKLFSN